MSEEIKYRYCMTCRVRYKATNHTGQACPKCGALLADTPTGVRADNGKKVAPPAPKVAAPVQAASVQPVGNKDVEDASGAKSEVGVPLCTAGDVFLCLLHNLLAGIPVVGLFWCGFSAFKNPLKNRVSKGTIMAGLVANIISAAVLILLTAVL